jgi:hypothetical protein
MNKKSKDLSIVIIIGLLYFMLLGYPNAQGTRDEHMLSLLSQDESIQYPYLMHMLTPGDSLFESLKNFLAYQHYFYGYPFYLFSALVVLPIRFLFGNQAFAMTQINLFLLRQMVSVLPMIFAAGILTYLQTKFRNTWKSAFIFSFLLCIPAVIRNNVWFWHPDGMTTLGAALTLFFLDRDHLNFKNNFYYAAIACGFTAATKLVGFFFFLTIAVYLLSGWMQKKINPAKLAIHGVRFILVFLLVFLALNPLLLIPQSRNQILKIQAQQNYFVTHGWQDEDIYEAGVLAWLPYLAQGYGSLLFLVLLLVSLVTSCLKGERRLHYLLILGWVLPYAIYLFLFVAIKPVHYWMPIMLPLGSTTGNLVPFDRSDRPFKHAEWLSNIIFLGVAVLIGFQFAQNVKVDIFQINRVMDQERLLLSCNSEAMNTQAGQLVNLESSRWYRVEVFDQRISPASRQFLVLQGPYWVSFEEKTGTIAWACASQESAHFSAERLAFYYKVDHPEVSVIGPDGVEIVR